MKCSSDFLGSITCWILTTALSHQNFKNLFLTVCKLLKRADLMENELIYATKSHPVSYFLLSLNNICHFLMSVHLAVECSLWGTSNCCLPFISSSLVALTDENKNLRSSLCRVKDGSSWLKRWQIVCVKGSHAGMALFGSC